MKVHDSSFLLARLTSGRGTKQHTTQSGSDIARSALRSNCSSNGLNLLYNLHLGQEKAVSSLLLLSLSTLCQQSLTGKMLFAPMWLPVTFTSQGVSGSVQAELSRTHGGPCGGSVFSGSQCFMGGSCPVPSTWCSLLPGKEL